jgi:protein TonB
MDIVVESRPANDAPETRIQPPPVSRAHAPAVRHNVPIEQLKTPKARTAAVRMDSSEAPPAMMGTLNLSDAGTANPLLAAAAAGPAPPPVSSGPTVGGQLQPPQILNSTAPVYPQMARMQKVQGVVTLDALVDETGKVAEATVIAGPQPLVRAAQESVRNWKYKPAQLNGKPIAVHTRISVRFALQ